MKPASSREIPEDVAWFNLRRSGAVTAKDMQAFSEWMEADPRNKAAYQELEAIWTSLDHAEEDPTIVEMRTRAENVVKSRERGRILGAVAAGVVLTCAGGFALANSKFLSELALFSPPPAQEFRTSIGQRTTVTLLDRSVVTLDTDTVLRVRYSMGKRLIELDRGRAFFEVAKDKHRPFVVAANGKTVRATGTAFDVRVDPKRFEVTLIEGRVRVEDQTPRKDSTTANMRPGWRLAVGDDTRWRMEPVDLRHETSWHSGVLLIDGPLAEAAAEMNRYSQRRIVFKGEPPDAQVIGNFRAGDVDHFVEAVRMNKLARVVSTTEDEIVLTAR